MEKSLAHVIKLSQASYHHALKENTHSQEWWHTTVIPAMQRTEAGGFQVQGQSQPLRETLS